MNTNTVTSTRNGQVYRVLPANEEREATPGYLWVQGEDGVAFTIKEKFTTPGGELAQPKPTEARRPANDFAGVVAANVKHDRQEARRAYYLRTGK